MGHLDETDDNHFGCENKFKYNNVVGIIIVKYLREKNNNYIENKRINWTRIHFGRFFFSY